MKAHDRRARDRRDFRPEPLLLEDRSLMCNSPAALSCAPVAPHALVSHTGWYHWNPNNWGQAVVVPAPHVVRATAVPHVVKVALLTGQIIGTISQPPTLPGQDVLASAIGQGARRRNADVRYLTAFLVHREDIFTGGSTINGGAAQFSSPRLGQIDVGYTGSEQLTTDPANGNFTLTGAVTSVVGGRYSRAAEGTFNALGTIDSQNGHFLMNYTICLFRTVQTVRHVR